MTSNVGATQTHKTATLGFNSNPQQEYDDMCSNYQDALKEKFRPEFLNRIDDIIVFQKLTKDQTAEIAELMLKGLKKRLAVMQIELLIDESAMDLITSKGYDNDYGARPLKRVIQRNIEDRLSEEILRGQLGEKSVITIRAVDGEFVFSRN